MKPPLRRKTGSAAVFVSELSSVGDLDDTVIISFDWNFLSQFHALAPQVKLGALGSGTINSTVINNVINAGANFLDWQDGGSITQAAVDLVHAAGLELHVWTVNNLSRMQQLIDLGVDGITTDAPETLRSIVPWPPIPGDYNGDNVVDAADYMVWRDTLGTSDKYDEWKTNFGTTRETSANVNASVPEPSAWLMATILGMVLVAFRQRESRDWKT